MLFSFADVVVVDVFFIPLSNSIFFLCQTSYKMNSYGNVVCVETLMDSKKKKIVGKTDGEREIVTLLSSKIVGKDRW